ncbi:hypothetical protein TI05_15690 [Achromatium sp. WMS3]|nr:hypothetical protein TI05_15690 [Achromatium sp. WMS3]
MSKQLFKRLIPKHDTIRNNKYLQIFGRLLHAPYLWHINRHSTAGAFAVGLFMAFVPVPFQMILAASSAIFFRVNLPLAVALVWVTNPITMPAIIYFCYVIGAFVLGYRVELFVFSIPDGGFWEFLHSMKDAFWPFLLGCMISGTIFSLLGYFGVHLVWRWHVIHRWNLRRTKRLIKN